ncbi:MAG: hypothetical protein C0505_14225 [Leptothrix sp. (in: Bacteria)]|nr:hypothetical protein [Leptothrix sp. (in: b-proteobacteria)]
MKARQACIHLLVFAHTGLPAAIAAWVVLGPSEAAAQHLQFDSVRARQFILVDSAGRYRGELRVDARGPALVHLAGADGKPGLTLG